MTRAADRLAAFVDSLLHERRPRRFPAEPDEGPALLAASQLKAARPGVDLPRADFISSLEARLAAEVARTDGATGGGGRISRRTVLQLTGLSAAAAVAGVMVDRVVNREPPPLSQKLVADAGKWVPVASTQAVAPGQAVRFSSGAVEGFVVNKGGQVQAMSAVCTHMGCLLHFNADRESLDCPCHGASFDLDGSPLSRTYLDALPTLKSRVRGTTIEVELPAQA